jgi:Putative transposase/Transposase zinc-binding domain
VDRPKLEVADIFRLHGDAFRAAHKGSLPPAHQAVMAAITQCRTAELGGHVEECDTCGNQRICYDSCRNRHCPKCQSLARAQWIDSRKAELLDTPYFHVVFTLPEEIAAIALQNKSLVYGLLFQATAETLCTIAADPKHLGAEIGFFAVLHTWGQNLMHHPHLHCVVPGGGLSPDRQRWIACRPDFFLPVRVLSRYFRRRFLELFLQAFEEGALKFFGILEPLRERQKFLAYVEPVQRKEWVVYAKAPFAGPEQVLDYVGRYTHRVAISNNRLLSLKDSQVTFKWKDYRDGDAQKTMTLSAEEFIRRFLLHVLPCGFHRIRYYGFMGNRCRQASLETCRRLLDMSPPSPSSGNDPSLITATVDYRDRYETLTGKSLRECPFCHQGHMIVLAILAPLKQQAHVPLKVQQAPALSPLNTS